MTHRIRPAPTDDRMVMADRLAADLGEIMQRSAKLPPLEQAMRPGTIVALLDTLHAAHDGKVSFDVTFEFVKQLIADEIAHLVAEWQPPSKAVN